MTLSNFPLKEIISQHLVLSIEQILLMKQKTLNSKQKISITIH